MMTSLYMGSERFQTTYMENANNNNNNNKKPL